MLEGLEVSELNFKFIFNHQYGRFDAEFFNSKFIRSEALIDSKDVILLSKIAIVTDGEHGSPDLDADSGIIYLSGNNIKDNQIDFENVRYCSEKLHQKNARSSVKKNTVLMSIVGTVGKTSVVHVEVTANTDRNVATIKPNENINAHYLSIFLNCFYGVIQTERLSTGNVQPLLNLSQIRQIKICNLSETFQLAIEKLSLAQNETVRDSKLKYTQAETLLLETLGMADFTPSSEAVNIKSFKDSFAASGRLDAEYYQPKYEDFEHHILDGQLSHTTVKAQFNLVKESSKRLKQSYQYVEISDVNVGDGKATTNFVETVELPANAKIEAKYGDVLVSKVRPNRGAIAIVDFDDTDLIVSGAFTVLRAKPDDMMSAESLKVLLRTKMYREWLLKFNVGTSYPIIRDDDVLDLPIPIIDFDIQQKIADLVQHSFALKARSAHLLDVAKRAVEMAIEQDEAAAFAFIASEVTDVDQ